MTTIYHITTQKTWNQAVQQNIYNFCTLKSDGFIHCSTSEQYVDVANRLFKNQTELLLLKIDQQLVNEKIVYENLEGGSLLYPHIYGALNIDAVVDVFFFKPNPQGEFEVIDERA